MLHGDLHAPSGEICSFPPPNLHPRRAEESDTETAIACEDSGSLSYTEFFANLGKNRAEWEAVIHGLTGNINTDRYALTIDGKKGVVTATWKNRGEYRNQHKRVDTRLNAIQQRKKMRAGCSAEISLRGIQGCVERCKLRLQRHSCWIYGELPTMPLTPSMFLHAIVHPGNWVSSLDHSDPAISDQLNVDPLESAGPFSTESAPMDGFGYYYLISPNFDT